MKRFFNGHSSDWSSMNTLSISEHEGSLADTDEVDVAAELMEGNLLVFEEVNEETSEVMKAAEQEKDTQILNLMKQRQEISHAAIQIEQQNYDQLKRVYLKYKAKSTGTIEELTQSLAEVKQEYTQYKEKATRQIIELNNEVQSKAREHYNLLIQLKEERKKCVDLYKSAGEKSSVAQENQRLQARIESKDEELQLLRANLVRLSESLAEAEQLMDETEVEIDKLNKVKDRCQDQVEAFSDQLKRERARADGLEGACRQMRDEMAACQKANNERLFLQDAKHRAAVERMQRDIKKLKAQVDTGRFQAEVKKEIRKSKVIKEEEEEL